MKYISFGVESPQFFRSLRGSSNGKGLDVREEILGNTEEEDWKSE